MYSNCIELKYLSVYIYLRSIDLVKFNFNLYNFSKFLEAEYSVVCLFAL